MNLMKDFILLKSVLSVAFKHDNYKTACSLMESGAQSQHRHCVYLGAAPRETPGAAGT